MAQWGSCCSIFCFLCSVLQIIVLLSLFFGHCIVVPSSIYMLVGFVLLDLQFSVQCFVDHCLSCCPFLLVIVLSFLLHSMTQWGSCCSIFSFLCSVLQIIVLLSISFGHGIVVPSSIYGLVRFVLFDLQCFVQCFVDHCLSCCPFPLAIVLSFLLQSMAQWDSCCSIFSLLCSVLQIIVCLVVPFFWPLYCRSFFNLWLSGVRVARSLVFCVVFCRSLFVLLSLSFGHCIVVPSSIYGLVGFVLLDLQFSVQCFIDHCLSCCPFLLAIVLSFPLQSMAQWDSCCSNFSFLCSVLQIIVCLVVPFFWPLYCRSFFNLWLSGVRVARSLVCCVVCCRSLFVFLSLSFGHCIVVPSSIYGLVGFVLLDLQFSVQCFIDHCLSCCPFLLAIVLSFPLQSMAQWDSCCSNFSFLCSVLQIIVCLVVPFFWPLYCRSFFNLWLSRVRVARSLVCCVVCCRSLFVFLSLSFDHCIVVPSSIYDLVGFVLLDLQFSVQCCVDHCLSCCPFLLSIVLSFLLQSMVQWGSCCSIFRFLLVFCRSLFVLLSLSFGHCIVVPSSIYGLVGFVLLDLLFSVQCIIDHFLSCFHFLLAIVLSFLLQSMAQWGSCSSIFCFLYSVLQIIVCLVVPFFCPLYCRSFFNLWLSGVRVPRSFVFCVVFCRSLYVLLSLSFGHCIVVPSSIYGLVGFVLLDLQFSVQCFVDHCMSCCPFLLAIVLSFLLQSMGQWGSCCSICSFLCSVLQIIVCLVVPFFWPLYCRSVFNLWLSGVRVARSLVFCIVFCRSLFILFSLSFGHCIVVPSSIYGLVGFVLLDLQFSVQCFVDHCLSCCPFLLAIVLSFRLQSMAQWGSCCSIFSFLYSVLQIIVYLVFTFFWPLYCRSFFNLWLSGVRVARSLVFCVVFCRSLFVLLSLSFGHCIVVPSSMYDLVGFVFLDLQFSVQCFVDHCLSCPLLLAIVLSFLLQSMTQWGSCCSICSFLCSVLQIIVCLVPFF